MDKKPKSAVRSVPAKAFLSSSSSSEEDNSDVEQANECRRSGMRFTSIEDFLASLNTATTAVAALQGLQTLSVENYQKCMPGAQVQASGGDPSTPHKDIKEKNDQDSL